MIVDLILHISCRAGSFFSVVLYRGAMNPDETVSSSTGIEQNPRGVNNLEESGNSINNSSTITPIDRYNPLANDSGEETTQIYRKRKHRKNRKSSRSKRVAITFKRGGYYNMLVKFLEDKPGISMDDRSTKVVTYTCNTKETIPVEFICRGSQMTFWD